MDNRIRRENVNEYFLRPGSDTDVESAAANVMAGLKEVLGPSEYLAKRKWAFLEVVHSHVQGKYWARYPGKETRYADFAAVVKCSRTIVTLCDRQREAFCRRMVVLVAALAAVDAYAEGRRLVGILDVPEEHLLDLMAEVISHLTISGDPERSQHMDAACKRCIESARALRRERFAFAVSSMNASMLGEGISAYRE